MEKDFVSDITHIMEGVIKDNNFSTSHNNKNIEYEIKEMTFIIFNQIYNKNKKFVKKIINEQYNVFKNNKIYQEIKPLNSKIEIKQGKSIEDNKNYNNVKELHSEIELKDTQNINLNEEKDSFENLNSEIESKENNKNCNSIEDLYSEINTIDTKDIVIFKKEKKDIKEKKNKKNSKEKGSKFSTKTPVKNDKKIKKKTKIDFKIHLKNNNTKDYIFCDKIINEWENKSGDEKMEYLTNQVSYLANLPQPEQRSDEWYKFRKGMLTASDLYKAIGTEGIRRALIIKKCKPQQPISSSGIGNACKHGIKYEDIAILIYEKMKNVKIFDYGCIQDKEFKIFGASPDGICGEGSGNLIGTMLEIKCPTSRVIIPGKVPDMYWKQIQGQLEVCKLWNCDFLECKIIECEKEIFEKSQKEKGIVIDILHNETNKNDFIYAPLNLFPNNYHKWLDNELDKIIENDDITFLKISYWILEDFNCVLVKRDPFWFYSQKPEIQKFWNEVLYYRENGYEILEKKTKKRVKKKKFNYADINECIIYSDSE